VCSLARETCTPIQAASAGSTVTLDPAWSPNGNLLAYVRAPTARAGGNPRLGWFDAHRLEVYDVSTGRSRRVGGIDGLSVPTWGRDGTSLLYVAHDALWLAPASGGRPAEIATPLFARSQWLHQGSIAYYGQIPWTDQFDWWSR
jgi:Tol biopolymer transport system component